MANIDYVVVGGGPSFAEVTAAVRDSTGSSVSDSGWLHPSDDRAALRVIVDPAGNGWVVQVFYSGGPVLRRNQLARAVYDSLVVSTDWDLVLDSDDSEGVLAERTKTIV